MPPRDRRRPSDRFILALLAATHAAFATLFFWLGIRHEYDRHGPEHWDQVKAAHYSGRQEGCFACADEVLRQMGVEGGVEPK